MKFQEEGLWLLCSRRGAMTPVQVLYLLGGLESLASCNKTEGSCAAVKRAVIALMALGAPALWSTVCSNQTMS